MCVRTYVRTYVRVCVRAVGLLWVWGGQEWHRLTDRWRDELRIPPNWQYASPLLILLLDEFSSPIKVYNKEYVFISKRQEEAVLLLELAAERKLLCTGPLLLYW